MASADDTLEESLSRPRQASGDFGQYSEHSLRDQLEVARYLNAQKIAKHKRPFRIDGITPGSAVGGMR